MVTTEEALMQRIRDKAETTKPKEVGPQTKVTKEEALREAEYIGKRFLAESQPPADLAGVQQLINEAMMMIYAYLHKVGIHIPPDELKDYLLREQKNG